MRTPRTLSPYILIQEFLRDEPWRLLAACIMLNQTGARQVWRILPEFFDRWPDPASLLAADEDEVKGVISSLGFKNVRYRRLVGMSSDWAAGVRPPERLYGVGKYAQDSYKLFCEGYLIPEVEDKELRNYVRWAQQETARVLGPECRDAGPGGVQQGLQEGAFPPDGACRQGEIAQGA